MPFLMSHGNVNVLSSVTRSFRKSARHGKRICPTTSTCPILHALNNTSTSTTTCTRRPILLSERALKLNTQSQWNRCRVSSSIQSVAIRQFASLSHRNELNGSNASSAPAPAPAPVPVPAHEHVDCQELHHSHHNHDDEQMSKHCKTRTCDEAQHEDEHEQTEPVIHDANSIPQNEALYSHLCQDDYLKNALPLPPPLPKPKFSFHRRIMPHNLIQFSSPEGRKLFQESLSNNMAKAFFPLSEQFLNQSDPAYCGVTTLIMVLNAIGIDPNVRWKGGWRWYGSEEMILESCCIDPERVRRAGILLEEFQSLGRCQGLKIDMKRPIPLESLDFEDNDGNGDGDGDARSNKKYYTLDDFRSDIIQLVQHPPIYDYENSSMDEETATESTSNIIGSGGFMVVSFSRSTLGQTGDGHFSPIAAYSAETDRCLILDVARFKYPPYWVPVKDIYESTRPRDDMTNKSRGWFIMSPPESSHFREDGSRFNFKGTKAVDERMRSADIVPLFGEKKFEHVCRVGDLKVQYCAVNENGKVRKK